MKNMWVVSVDNLNISKKLLSVLKENNFKTISDLNFRNSNELRSLGFDNDCLCELLDLFLAAKTQIK